MYMESIHKENINAIVSLQKYVVKMYNGREMPFAAESYRSLTINVIFRIEEFYWSHWEIYLLVVTVKTYNIYVVPKL